jgi:hypothetical protein
MYSIEYSNVIALVAISFGRYDKNQANGISNLKKIYGC